MRSWNGRCARSWARRRRRRRGRWRRSCSKMLAGWSSPAALRGGRRKVLGVRCWVFGPIRPIRPVRPIRTPNTQHPLPLQLTRFFGREEEIARLTELLAPSVSRLVTLTGPGGSGKTRLAVAAVGRMVGASLDISPDRRAVAFVDLADVTDAARIPDAISGATGLGRSPEV